MGDGDTLGEVAGRRSAGRRFSTSASVGWRRNRVGFEVWRDEALVSHGTLVVARAER